MLTIHKYSIPIEDRMFLELPAGAKILTVQVQTECPQIWALVDTEQPLEARFFRMVGTGHPITEDILSLSYIGTFQLQGGGLIFHLFEIPEERN